MTSMFSFKCWNNKAASTFKCMHGILMIVVPIVTSENCNYYFKGKHVFKNLCPPLEDSSLKEKHC